MTATAQSTAAQVFRRVVAGVDGSESGLEAARQAARLVSPDGTLELFTAVYLPEANLGGWSAPRIRAQLEGEAGEAVRRAGQIAGPRASTRLVNGPPLQSLRHELEEEHATLAVIGTHGHGRLSEIVVGGVAGPLLHDAPCSLWVARPPAAEALFPRAIVVGVDGSALSETALAVARYLAERFSASLLLVTALGGKRVNLARAAALGAAVVEGDPVATLVAASHDADVLVVGNRGLHGLKALGSVSERVAHAAASSVLVVRGSA